MKTEYEIKILDIDIPQIQETLKAENAKFTGEKKFRRYVYDLPDNKSWMRLRTDGKKTVLTVKKVTGEGISGTQELEIVVDDFEKTYELLESLGFTPRVYQENNRLSYDLDNVELDIDQWPKIPAYLEIEGQSEADVQSMIEKLGLTEHKKTAESTEKVYMMYNLDLNSYKELGFDK
jgi:adenylate cyclase class 2